MAAIRRMLEKQPDRSLTLKAQLAEHGADRRAGRGKDRSCLQPRAQFRHSGEREANTGHRRACGGGQMSLVLKAWRARR